MQTFSVTKQVQVLCELIFVKLSIQALKVCKGLLAKVKIVSLTNSHSWEQDPLLIHMTDSQIVYHKT